MSPTFDEIDQELLDARIAARKALEGPQVGDWIKMLDGTVRRFTHNWGDGLQTTIGNGDSGRFYFSKCGHLSYSGGLDDMIPLDRIEPCENELLPGFAWFFHHDSSGAHRGVDCVVECRVYREKEADNENA